MEPSVEDLWQVDRRPRTPWTRLYVLAMWLNRDKSAFEGAARTRRTAGERQRHGDRPPTWWTRITTRVGRRTVDGGVVWSARPRRRAPRARVVYLHGGGYVHPLTADYWRLVRALVRAGAEVVVPLYPLAPRHTVDEALPWLLAAELATRPDPEVPTVLMGDSAGGALALVLSARLRGTDGAPRRVVALCPWLDANLEDPAVGRLEPTDPMLAESGLRAAARWWSGSRSPADEVVSPIHGDLSGLPPVHVYIGDHDILRPAVDELVAQLAAVGGEVHVREVPAMFHVWMTRAIPEGRRTRRELADLIASTTSGPPRSGGAAGSG